MHPLALPPHPPASQANQLARRLFLPGARPEEDGADVAVDETEGEEVQARPAVHEVPPGGEKVQVPPESPAAVEPVREAPAEDCGVEAP